MKERTRSFSSRLTPTVMVLVAVSALLVALKILDWLERNPTQYRRQSRADAFIHSVYYVKDPRTGDCFARSTESDGFSVVSCERIPRNLLIVARVR